mmetsp:Transcript_16679/g.20985  ORF Transcript_16679/g.20985 Transcript_16679/m.20985 type:complete len:91 (-) Transcript_16679:171-443(-)
MNRDKNSKKVPGRDYFDKKVPQDVCTSLHTLFLTSERNSSDQSSSSFFNCRCLDVGHQNKQAGNHAMQSVLTRVESFFAGEQNLLATHRK